MRDLLLRLLLVLVVAVLGVGVVLVAAVGVVELLLLRLRLDVPQRVLRVDGAAVGRVRVGVAVLLLRLQKNEIYQLKEIQGDTSGLGPRLG